MKKNSKPSSFEPVSLGAGDNNQVRYINGLLRQVITPHTDIVPDRQIYNETLWVGRRTFSRENDGIELYYFHVSIRHSLAVIEFSQDQMGYKLILHSLVRSLIPKEKTPDFVALYNAVFMRALFPNFSFINKEGHICLQTQASWVPTRVDVPPGRHFVIMHADDVVDAPNRSNQVGSAPGRNDRWHTKFVEIRPATAEVGTRINELARRTVTNIARSSEQRFDPDTEVSTLNGDQL